MAAPATSVLIARRRLALLSDHLEWLRPNVSQTTYSFSSSSASPASDGDEFASGKNASNTSSTSTFSNFEDFADSRNRPIWSFVTAAAYHGKPEDRSISKAKHELPSTSPVRRWVEGTLQKHASSGKDGKINGGQDWWFVQEMKDRSGVALGVADGVGGWSEEGIDPSGVAQGLMYYAARMAGEKYAGEEQLMDEEEVATSSASSSAGSTNTGGNSSKSSLDSLGDIRQSLDDGRRQSTSGASTGSQRPNGLVGTVLRKGRKDARVAHPHELVAKSFAEVLSDSDIHGGASTSLISTLNSRSGELRWANLGDSSLVILRKHKIIVQSTIQTHYFNCPYQLTKLPQGYRNKPGMLRDEPRQASLGKFQLQDGDLVVLFTDGFGDNVFGVELERAAKAVLEGDTESSSSETSSDGDSQAEGGSSATTVTTKPTHATDEKRVERLAYMLCYLARMISMQRDRVTPFEVEAKQNRIYDLSGGKVDDITVVCALVRER